MPKLNVGDKFRYKSNFYNFTAILLKRTKQSDGIEWQYQEKILDGNFLGPGRIGYSGSSEDRYITILEHGGKPTNLETKTPNGETIKTTIRKIK